MAGKKKASQAEEASEKKRRWLIGAYRPVSLFSLRMSHSTSSGGKTLFVPTPYAFKLALVDAAFRAGGRDTAEEIFQVIKGLEVRACPPRDLVVNHTFMKIKREPKTPTPDKPYISTIGFREYCFFSGDMQIALGIGELEEAIVKKLQVVFAHVNYFGKRGSFFQYRGSSVSEELPMGFTLPVPEGLEKMDVNIYNVTQFLDDLGDLGAKDLFERINTYSNKPIELNKHRVFKQTFLPYTVQSSSKNYTHYKNLSEGL